jgi:putative DNA primase/helicase
MSDRDNVIPLRREPAPKVPDLWDEGDEQTAAWSTARIGHRLLEDYDVIFVHDNLYVYDRGVFRPEGEYVVRGWLRIGLANFWTIYRVKEVIQWLKDACRVNAAAINGSELLNVANGMLDWRSGKLYPHAPKYLSTIQIPTPWIAEAFHRRGNLFLNEVLPHDGTRKVFEEFAGYILVPHCKYQVAAMATDAATGGSGSNGKSVSFDWLESMLGSENTSHLSLEELDDRFNGERLVGKLLNVDADIPRDGIKNPGKFKKLVTGDPIKAEAKYKTPFFYKPSAKLLFGANAFPRTRDASGAYMRRWLVFPFPNRFKKGDCGFDPNLSEKLRSELARAYLLRLAVEGLRRLDDRGFFQNTPAMRNAVEAYSNAIDSVKLFTKERCTISDKCKVGKDDLYTAYAGFCEQGGLRAVSKIELGRRLNGLLPLKEDRTNTNTGRVRRWVGIGLRDEKVASHD